MEALYELKKRSDTFVKALIARYVKAKDLLIAEGFPEEAFPSFVLESTATLSAVLIAQLLGASKNMSDEEIKAIGDEVHGKILDLQRDVITANGGSVMRVDKGKVARD